MKIKFLLLLFLFTSPLFSQEDRIISYHLVLDVQEDSDIVLRESITLNSEQNQISHGIYRSLPDVRKDKNGVSIPVAYEVLEILKNGEPEKYQIREGDGNKKLYIGDASIILVAGIYTYDIKYRTSNQIGFYEDYNEIYWNVYGDSWDFSADTVSAVINLPDGSVVRETSCYTGSYGSKESKCQSYLQPEVYFDAYNLKINENLTIVVAFDKGTIQEPLPPSFFEKYRLLFLGLILVLALFSYYIFTWMRYGVDPPTPAIYPQYSPPENMSPSAMGVIYGNRVSKTMITPAIINLAVKGYIIIEEVKLERFLGIGKGKSNYTITRIKESDNSLPKEERIILDNLFSGSSKSVTLSGTFNATVKKTSDRYLQELKEQFTKLLNEGNNYKFIIIPLVLSIIFFVVSIFSGDLYFSTELLNFLTGGLVYLIVTSGLIFPIIFSVTRATKRLSYVIFFIICISLLAGLIYFRPTTNLNGYIIIGFSVFALVSLILYTILIKKPAEEKLRLQSLVNGFKMYMEAAEDNQIQNFNPPEMTPELFEEYLPYAIALGTDEIWGQKFEKYIKNSIAIDEYNSPWYRGNRGFSADLYHILNSSVLRNIQNASDKPQSRSTGGNSGRGSWSSGSGGGGFSGGGGGGGGGGGW